MDEIPVDWVDDPRSSVDLIAAAVADLKGVWRIGRALATGSLPLAKVGAQLGGHPFTPDALGVPSGMSR